MKHETMKLSVQADTKEKRMPEKKFRSGAIHATIWSNSKEVEGKQTVYKTVSFERSYLDKNKEWQNTNSLRIGDLPKAVLVLSKAYEYLALSNDVAEAAEEEH